MIIPDGSEWELLPVVCHRLGVDSDLAWNLAVTGVVEGRLDLDLHNSMTRMLRIGPWSNDRLLKEIETAESMVYESRAELRADEEVIRTVGKRLQLLRGRNLGRALKRQANEALYGLATEAYGIYLEHDRLRIEARYFIDDHVETAWVHFFPNEEKARARNKPTLRLLELD
ncbi:MAG: hypothetical protein ABR567_17190 [Myxococcales bacterium]